MNPTLRIVCAIAALAGTAAYAEDIADAVDLSGTFETELSIGTATGDIQKTELVLTPEITIELTPTSRLTVIGRLRGDIVDDLEPNEPDESIRSDSTKRLFFGKHADFELREAYVDTEIGNTFLRVGKQQVVWGQADGLKVLDVLNPQSFREFILDDFEDSRIPLWIVNVEMPIGESVLQLLWIPDTSYDDLPEAGATFAFTSPQFVPAIPPIIPVTFDPLERPDDIIEDSDFAAKLSVFAGGWDLSLNYAYHYFDRPIVRREISESEITVQQSYERTHLLGGTFSNVFGDFTLRGEVGYSSDRYFLNNDITDTDGVSRSGEFSYVLGIDYQGWRDWFVSTQIFQSIVTDTAPGLVRDSVNTNMTLLVRRDFLNDGLRAETLVIQSLNQNDGVLQASVIYELRSNTRLKAKLDMFYGEAEGLFGQFDRNDRVSMGIEIGF